jgi:hypothetical protein
MTAGSQRLAQGGIDNFDLEFTSSNVTLSLGLSIMALSSLETGAQSKRRWKFRIF